MPDDRRIRRRLRLRDLDTLMAVAQTGSMAKAAALLSVSQPAVSKAIAEMERAVGKLGIVGVMVNTFDRDAAEGEVVSELPVGDGERREVVTEPVRKNLHESTFLV